MVDLVAKINTKNEIEGAEKFWENLCIPIGGFVYPVGKFLFLTRFIYIFVKYNV